jgi:hypothetical protein
VFGTNTARLYRHCSQLFASREQDAVCKGLCRNTVHPCSPKLFAISDRMLFVKDFAVILCILAHQSCLLLATGCCL